MGLWDSIFGVVDAGASGYAMAKLKERYENGEISYSEYERQKEKLRDGYEDRKFDRDVNRALEGKDEGCFITTATTLSIGKGDNSYELNSFRAFRDNWLVNQKNGKEIISEYYLIAPKIVEKIDNSSESKTIYKSIWDNYLLDSLHFIETEQFQRAKERYSKMVLELKAKFL